MRGDFCVNIDYATKTQEVIIKLEEGGYSAKTVNEHRRCFEELRKHLLSSGASFTMEEGLVWLESRKNTWVTSTYARYRCALYRFEKYLRCGEISRDSHCGNNNFAYHDTDVSYNNLPSVYKEVYRKFHEVICYHFSCYEPCNLTIIQTGGIEQNENSEGI